MRLNRFANRDLIHTLEALGAEITLATVMEWFYYTNWHFAELEGAHGRYRRRLVMQASDLYQRYRERRLRKPLAHLLPTGPEQPTGRLVAAMRRYGNPALECETVMTIGKAAEMAEEGIDGIINVMPFSCMAGIIASGLAVRLRRDHDNVPWLDLSYDLQRTTNLQTRLEAFMDQASHRHARRLAASLISPPHQYTGGASALDAPPSFAARSVQLTHSPPRPHNAAGDILAMANTHTTRLVRIGNGQGIRIPKRFLKRLGIGDEVELIVEQATTCASSPCAARRAGWAEQFAAMAANGDDAPILPSNLSNEFDTNEWQW